MRHLPELCHFQPDLILVIIFNVQKVGFEPHLPLIYVVPTLDYLFEFVVTVGIEPTSMPFQGIAKPTQLRHHFNPCVSLILTHPNIISNV